MIRAKDQYNLKHRISAILMVLALIWLTASLPFVYEAQQAIKKTTEQTNNSGNPLSNTTEEKTPSTTSLSEEYLHHEEDTPDFFTEVLTHANGEFIEVYVAFHGELLSPPPEA